MLTISPEELHQLLDTSAHTIDLIDVRGTGEYSETHIPEARNIPLHILPIRTRELDTTKQIIFICRSGARSGQATIFADGQGIKAHNLSGGMVDYERLYGDTVIRWEKKKLFGIL